MIVYPFSFTNQAITQGLISADNYLNAVVTSGGTGMTSTISAATRNLFIQLYANNLYSKIDIMYPCLGGVSASIAINAKRNTTYDIVFSGGWTFSSSGATGNGSNNVGYTNYKPGIVDTMKVELIYLLNYLFVLKLKVLLT